MTIEYKTKDEVITFIPKQIYRKTQIGLTDGLLLTHAIHCINMWNIFYVHFLILIMHYFCAFMCFAVTNNENLCLT